MSIKLKKKFISTMLGLTVAGLISASCTPSSTTGGSDSGKGSNNPNQPSPTTPQSPGTGETSQQPNPGSEVQQDPNLSKTKDDQNDAPPPQAEPPQPKQPSKYDNKVIFQTSQNDFYPLMHAMSVLVDEYNKEHKDEKGYFEVILQKSDQSKARSETTLTRNVTKAIQENNPDIPNIILANLNSGYQIDKLNRLLDFGQSKILNKDNFDEEIIKYYTKGGSGADKDKILAIPFDLTTLDSFVFNKPVMNLLFDFVEKGGGTVNKDSQIYKELKIDDFMKKIPATKKWHDLELKNPKAFDKYVVNDETFSNLESVLEFSKKMISSLKLKANPSTSIPTRDLKIFMTDGLNIINKYLWSKLGNTDSSWLWTNNDKADKFKPDYSNIKKEDTIKKIGDAYDVFKNNFGTFKIYDKEIKGKKISPKLYSWYVANGGTTDWTSWDIRTFDTAFGFGPHVGWNQSVISPFVLKTFRKNPKSKLTQKDVEEASQNFAFADQVLWKNQLTKFDKTQKDNNTFLIGGSSLVAIKTDEARDKQTIKFLEWLLDGKTKINLPNSPYNNKTPLEILNSISSYTLTTKDALTDKKRDELDKRIKEQEDKVNKDIITQKKFWEGVNSPEWSQLYLNKGALATLDDWLNYKKEFKKDNKKNSITFYYEDEFTSRLISAINSSIFSIARPILGTQSKDAMLKTIKKRISDHKEAIRKQQVQS
ncbi:P68 family surface lipoprotein [Mycoplasma sp. E35C]|uniref:P68 family surface lipoprotein n=1 Tax=Mycoplasma sp. E35C TaxID=2801918 RepID=UPI001CA40C80|nr:hypothetical protein [Mycoplasma sp. E35C]QZX48957.1 hypothetical protein JJE79_02780 [Mycoplasma sp. E35C]